MTAMATPYSVRDSTNTTTDNRKGGLTPTVSNGKTLAASPATVLASTVTIVEIGSGDYIALYDAEANLDASFPIDWGSVLANPNDRYGTLVLTRDSGRVLGSLSATGANVNQFAGHAVVLDGNNYPGVNIVDVAGAAAKTAGGTAQSGSATNIRLDTGDAGAGGPLTGGWSVELTGGTGAGQWSPISAYNSSTRDATTVWVSPFPASGTTYLLHSPSVTAAIVAGAITSSAVAIGTVNASATGFFEKLMLAAYRFFPLSGGSVTAPKSGNGSIVVKTTGGTTIATQSVSDDGTTQTLGAAS